MYEARVPNPTLGINVSWNDYVHARRSNTDAHLVGGIPDYAFALDCNLRQKLHAMPGFERIAKAIANAYLPQIRQQYNLNSLKLGPTQMPEIYNMAVDCARTLGIGIPDVFIEHDSQMNAYAYAMEDDSPLLVVTSGMLNRATPAEIKTVIGHECGHIHNNHTVYTLLADLLFKTAGATIPSLGTILSLASTPMKYALSAWSRAAEITADRAGIICSEKPEDMYSLQAKLMSGGVLNVDVYDVDAILRQYDAVRGTSIRLEELYFDHPSGARRILAAREFIESEVLYHWRPELKVPGMVLTNKDELDTRCNEYVAVLRKRKRDGR
jgi:Zn-dependent protease with chaperone function